MHIFKLQKSSLNDVAIDVSRRCEKIVYAYCTDPFFFFLQGQPKQTFKITLWLWCANYC